MIRCWLLAGVCLLAAPALAQTTPGSEEQRRRAAGAEERLLRQQAPDVRLQPPAPLVDREDDLPGETPCFRIDRVFLDGQRTDAFAWLDIYLNRYAGRCIGALGIDLVVRRASALAVAKGFITTRLVIPEQELAGGTLRLVLIPGVIRAIRFSGDGAGPGWRSAFPARQVLN